MAEQGFDLWLEFEVWEPKEDDDPEDDCFNMSIKLADGREYALNVWTFKFLARAVQECRESGEHLRGAYLEVPDLFVQRLDRALIEKVVADLIADPGLKDEWLVRQQQVSLRLVVLKTQEIDKLRIFYECLGMILAAERHGQGPLHYAGQLDNVVLEVYPLPSGHPANATTRLGFSVPKLEDVFRSLQAVGAPIIEAPRDTAWGRRAVVRDPDGRAVELYHATGG